MVEGVGNRSGHRALNAPRFSWGGKRIKQPQKPMKWLHSHDEGCVEGMVQECITTFDKKRNGERELTIVDPPENSEEVQAQLNATARSAEEGTERDDDGHDNVNDVDGEAPDGFQSSEFDESIVLVLSGLINADTRRK
jgi:hypothetical protein